MNDYIKISFDYLKELNTLKQFEITYIAVGDNCYSSIKCCNKVIVFSEFIRKPVLFIPSYKHLSEEKFLHIKGAHVKTIYYISNEKQMISNQEINVVEYLD